MIVSHTSTRRHALYVQGEEAVAVSFFHYTAIIVFIFFFFLNDPATTEIYPLPLHDALPILAKGPAPARSEAEPKARNQTPSRLPIDAADPLASFRKWSADYVNASPADRAAMTAEGIGLAEARRPALKQLIKENPRRALDESVPMVVRQQLPAEVVGLLEERVSGRAALRVYQGVGADNASPAPTVRVAEF